MFKKMMNAAACSPSSSRLGSLSNPSSPSNNSNNSSSSSSNHHHHHQHHNNGNNNNNTSINNTDNNNSKNKKLFPKKLWDLINNEKYCSCLRWSEDGQFVYLNRDEFEDFYLKTAENQFHTQKAISFVRQMNMYGFRKVDECYYENDNFKRGCEHLLANMIRKHTNKNHLRSPPAADEVHGAPKQMLLDTQARRNHQPAAGESVVAAAAAANGIKTTAAVNQSDDNPFVEQGAADLRTFYALLSTLSNNLYQQQAPPANAYQVSMFDTKNKFIANLPQQFYHNITAQFGPENSLPQDTPAKDIFLTSPPPSSNASSMQTKQWTLGTASLPPCQANLDGVSSATSLLANSNNNTASDLSIKNYRTSNPLGTMPSNDPSNGDNLASARASADGPISSGQKRRDSRINRAFKRNVDSILDSNHSSNSNNNGNHSERMTMNNQHPDSKRMRLEFYQENKHQPIINGVNELAKNLVSEVALSRDAHLDSNVLLEASKYTECFVQTLFDTALVIARHSNGLNLSDYMLTADNCQLLEENEFTNESEYERSNISVSDLTSALKLLPSKLLKIIQ